jgi:hypothetical protein
MKPLRLMMILAMTTVVFWLGHRVLQARNDKKMHGVQVADSTRWWVVSVGPLFTVLVLYRLLTIFEHVQLPVLCSQQGAFALDLASFDTMLDEVTRATHGMFTATADVHAGAREVKNLGLINSMTLDAWKRLGGSKHTHVYGEVLPESMFEMLRTAMCLEAPKKCDTPEGLMALFAEYDFYDLGSGRGLFPMFASALGFRSARGIELDTERNGVAQSALKAFDAQFPCLAGRLTFEKGNFLRPDDAAWTGTSKRVIFINAVDYDSFWTPIEALLKKGGHGYAPETVVIVNGRELDRSVGLRKDVEKIMKFSWCEQKCAEEEVTTRWYRYDPFYHELPADAVPKPHLPGMSRMARNAFDRQE